MDRPSYERVKFGVSLSKAAEIGIAALAKRWGLIRKNGKPNRTQVIERVVREYLRAIIESDKQKREEIALLSETKQEEQREARCQAVREKREKQQQ